ncbi:Heat shock 70 kDa protein BIP2 [Linum perenne]
MSKPTMNSGGDVIGIDLGTSFSCVAVARDGNPEIIVNDLGNRTTPSFVAFSAVDSQLLIGEAAKNQAVRNPNRTVFDVKRLMGKNFTEIQKDLPYLPYNVVSVGGKAYLELEVKHGEIKNFSPEEISAMILGKMKEIAESWLGKPVAGAVVTVPAYFNDAQRQATKDAGVIAGLNVLRVVNEPTAAAIAYALNPKNAGEMQRSKRSKSSSKILVYDLGGGTFDVSVLEVQDGTYEVLATGGDAHLGGGDFDRKLMDHFIGIIKKKYKKDITGDSRALGKLRKACERAKRDLSNQNEVMVEIEYFVDGRDFSESLTRARFEGMNMHLFTKTFDVVEKTLVDAEMDKSEIDEIVLVGGSTRIPKLKEMLKQMFNGKEPCQGVNPDEAVACGAAVLGLNLSGQASANGVTISDVTPLSLGIKVQGGMMSVVIPRNTRIPTTKSGTFYTVDARQTSVAVEVHILGFSRGVASVEVTFIIDADGILNITAKDSATTNSESLTIAHYKSSLTENEMERMIREAKQMAKEDKIVKAQVEAKNRLEQLINDISYALEGYIDCKGEKENLQNAIVEATTCVENGESSKEDYEKKMQRIVSLWNPFICKIYGREDKK